MKLTTSIISPILIAAIVCVGCDSVDDFNPTDTSQTYITFDQPQVTFDAVGAPTRATLIKTADLNKFTVCGFCVPQNVDKTSILDYSQAGASWAGKSKFCRPNVFGDGKGTDKATAEVRKKGSSWEYDDLKKWISPFDAADEENKKFADGAQFSFIAWANGNFTLQNFSTKTSPQLEFKMPFSGGSERNPIICDHNAVEDALIAEIYDREASEESGRVSFNFRHILTALRFRVANYSKETLTIKKMIFSGKFFGRATFTFEASGINQDVDRNANLYWGSFTIVDENTATIIPGNTLGRIIGITDKNPDGTNLLLLPDPDVDPTNPDERRTALGDNKKMYIEYRLTAEDGTFEDLSASIDVSLSYAPKQSTRHTATFNFLGKNQFYLVFKPEKDIWEDGSDDYITIN